MKIKPATRNTMRGLMKWFRGRARPRRGFRGRTIGTSEVLENRQMLTTMLYLDCGGELATHSTSFQATVDDVKNVDGVGMHTARGTGPDMNQEIGLAGSEMLTFKQLDYDWNRNGVGGEQDDVNGVCTQVRELVKRSLEPYDIQVEITSSGSLQTVVQTLNANSGATGGEFDAYVFLGSVFYNQEPIDDDDDDAKRALDSTGPLMSAQQYRSVSAGSISLLSSSNAQNPVPTGVSGTPVSVGLTHGVRGMAAQDDFHNGGLYSQFYAGKNQQDEMAITFADQVLKQTRNHKDQGNPFVNRRLAFGLADSVLRNAMTTYGLHEVGAPGDIVEGQLTMAETMRHPDSNRDDYFTHNISSNFDFKDANNPGGEWYNPWNALKTDNDVGLRDDNQNGVPDIAYITGSGTNDRIRVVETSTGYDVTVTPYRFKNLTGIITGRQQTYSIQIGVDTEGPILVDASHGRDTVEVINIGRHDRAVTIRGGHSHDTITAGNAQNVIYGDHGHDTISGGVAKDTIYGGYGKDFVKGSHGSDTIYGESGSLYVGGGHPDRLNGQGGNDTIYGDGGRDTLHGGNNRDYLYGGSGNDQMYGQNGNDRMTGGGGRDTMNGGNGADILSGGKGNDLLLGQDGADKLFGGSGADTLDGGNGNDKLFGNAGNDHLAGGNHNDFIRGGGGSDTMEGGFGADTMYGGSGADRMFAKQYKPLSSPPGVYLDSDSNFNDQALDKLWGQGDLDWLHGSASSPKDLLTQ